MDTTTANLILEIVIALLPFIGAVFAWVKQYMKTKLGYDQGDVAFDTIDGLIKKAAVLQFIPGVDVLYTNMLKLNTDAKAYWDDPANNTEALKAASNDIIAMYDQVMKLVEAYHAQTLAASKN
jgi:hypothetical protein